MGSRGPVAEVFFCLDLTKRHPLPRSEASTGYHCNTSDLRRRQCIGGQRFSVDEASGRSGAMLNVPDWQRQTFETVSSGRNGGQYLQVLPRLAPGSQPNTGWESSARPTASRRLVRSGLAASQGAEALSPMGRSNCSPAVATRTHLFVPACWPAPLREEWAGQGLTHPYCGGMLIPKRSPPPGQRRLLVPACTG